MPESNFAYLILLVDSFCIIEGPETVQDFMQMQLQEIQENIRSRRSKIFLLMEEVKYYSLLLYICCVHLSEKSIICYLTVHLT